MIDKGLADMGSVPAAPSDKINPGALVNVRLVPKTDVQQ